jgi:hypothetical protein
MSSTNNANNVSTGKPDVAGAVFRAPLGTTLPTTPGTTLDSAFKPMGYISEEGLTNSQSREGEDIPAWGGDVVDNVQTKKTDTFKMKFIEVLNTEVLKAAYGDENVSGTDLESGITIRSNSKELDHAAWVIDRIYKGGVKSRTVIPDGKPTAIEDIVYRDNQAVGFDMTIKANPVEAFDGDTSREYLKKTSSGESGASGESGTSGQSGTP